MSPPAGSHEGRPHTKAHNVEGPLVPLSQGNKKPAPRYAGAGRDHVIATDSLAKNSERRLWFHARDGCNPEARPRISPKALSRWDESGLSTGAIGVTKMRLVGAAMTMQERDYFLLRAQQEDEAARRSTNSQVRGRHEELGWLYRMRLQYSDREDLVVERPVIRA